jgi:hypothetical protein
MRSQIRVILAIASFLLSLPLSIILTTSISAAGEIQLPSCPYSVIFPGQPEVKEHSAPVEGGFIRWYAASQKAGVALLRHECMCVRGMNRDRMSEVFVRQRLTEFAASTGLSKPDFSPMPFQDGIAMTMRGYKNIQNIPTTYEATGFITSDCYLDVVVGAPSTDFPPAQISAFRASLSPHASADTGPPAAHWNTFQRSPSNATRSIDLNQLSVHGSVITYLQRFQTSSGGRIVLSKNQLDCGTGYGRTEEVLFFDPDGVLLSGIQYSPSESPFAPVRNDPSMSILRPVLCDGQLPAHPDDMPIRFRAAGLDLK